MLSRVADSLYWMSRYLERAEHTARLLDVNLSLMLDDVADTAPHRWQRLMISLGKPRRLKADGDPYELARQLTFDTGQSHSVVSCIISARENARHVREQISTEMWQRLNSLYLAVTRPDYNRSWQRAAGESESEGPGNFLNLVMEAVHQFQGVTDSTMSHGEGWHFIQMGRYMERATAMSMLLEAYNPDIWSRRRSGEDPLPEGAEQIELNGLLRSATAFEAYCKVYTADLSSDRVLEFLLLNAEFPHSLRFSVDGLQHSLAAIERWSAKRNPAELTRIAGRLSSTLTYATVTEILSGDVIGLLRRIQHQCTALHHAVFELYVDYSVQTALAG